MEGRLTLSMSRPGSAIRGAGSSWGCSSPGSHGDSRRRGAERALVGGNGGPGGRRATTGLGGDDARREGGGGGVVGVVRGVKAWREGTQVLKKWTFDATSLARSPMAASKGVGGEVEVR
jgi:hypothetical protein